MKRRASIADWHTVQPTSATSVLALLILTITLSPAALASCPKPDIKPNSEFFKADAVFTGKILSERYRELDDDHSGWFYRVRLARVFKGSFKEEAVVYTGQDSNSFPLEIGSDYLLFAYRWRGRLNIDNCGNSALLSKSSEPIRQIESIAATADGEIEGWLASESERVDFSGIEVALNGSSGVYRTITDRNGWFHIRVPKGVYRVDFGNHQYYVPDDSVWYNPKHFTVHAGESVGLWMMAFRK